jgi:regulator of sirC expression with transglutaminase-like and TPR domain
VHAPRERFAELAGLPDARLPLAEAALVLAAEEYPELEPEVELARLDALAASAAPRLAGAASDAERAVRLLRFLHDEEGFTGNEQHYGDPRNSYLNEVLARRTGLPITLSLVLVEVGRRLGLPLVGVGFPGHVLARLEGAAPPAFDAFHGRLLDAAGCTELLRAVAGPGVALDPVLHLRAAGAREVLVRMLTNLKQVHARVRDFGRALGCCERILLLTPDAAHELRDRGLCYAELECFAAAASDFERFLALAPDDPSAPQIRERLRAARATRVH